MQLLRIYLESVENKKMLASSVADVISFFATRKCQKIRKINGIS